MSSSLRTLATRSNTLAALSLAALVTGSVLAGRAIEVAHEAGSPLASPAPSTPEGLRSPPTAAPSPDDPHARFTRLLVAATTAGALALAFGAAAAWRCRHVPGQAPTEAAPDTPWARLQQVADDVPAVIGCFDASERCLFANAAARRFFFDMPPTPPFAGIALRTALGEADHLRYRHHIEAVKSGSRVSFEAASPRGDSRHQVIHLVPDRGSAGAGVQGFCMIVLDSTGAREAELARAEGERHLKSITDNVPALITYVDRDQRVTFANATFQTWLGVDPEGMKGRQLSEILGREMYEQRKGFIARGLAGEQVSFELPTRTPRGVERYLRTTYIPDIVPDGGVAGIVVLVTDVSAMKAVELELQHIARIDTLTQLPNRRQLDETLAQTLQGLPRRNRHAALLFLDIDFFKSINDTHGHAAGDAVLVEFAARLTAAVRSSDTVSRLGGDEFVVLVEGLSNELAEATLIAEKIRTQLRRPMAIGELEVVVTSSIGIALINELDLSAAVVMERADQALYQAKHAGRNTYAVFDAGKAASQADGEAADSTATGEGTPG